MALDATEILITIAIVLAVFYYYSTLSHSFWKYRNVIGPKPIPIFGTIKDIVFGKYSTAVYLRNVYNEYPNQRMVGIYKLNVPVLVLNDPHLIKMILVKDFKRFMDRGIRIDEKHEPLQANLFNLESKRWRPLRTKVTPVFTSGKLREMFYLLIDCANQLENYLDSINDETLDIREISAKFMTDVIAVCAYGLQANAMADDKSTFRQMGKRIFKFNGKNLIALRMKNFVPCLFKYIAVFFVDHDLTNFFLNLTRDTVEYRKKNNINRHDFVDLLMALREEPNENSEIELTDSLMAAQLFIFFLAGFETSSSTVSNCLFELAQNHEIRDELRREIKNHLTTSNGAITYEGIKKMKYLDKVVMETLRKYPPVPVLMRKSTAAYTFPGTEVSIPNSTRVWIPIFAIQRDPKYFPNPDKFDPARFDEEAIRDRPPMVYLPLGAGPRNCIGGRFGRMQTKIALIKILQNHTVDVCDKTDKNYTIDPAAFLLTPKNGIYLQMKKQQFPSLR